MFVDECVVEFISGKGGNGVVSFHREKHVPRGGPNGANGGRGGDIILTASRHERTLYDFKLKKIYESENGADAIGNKKGKDGSSVNLHVPIGTLVVDESNGKIIADLDTDGKSFTLCKGGRGGFGNLHYVSSVRQVPKIAENGEPGKRILAKLELKLLADVGLIGLPNAGKSTLLSVLTSAKPKIGNYPFTTITPNLGVVVCGEENFTIADMPGLIEFASEGAGLGIQFLKHIERTKMLVHVVDAFPLDESCPIENYKLIRNELANYSKTLSEKKEIVALNKLDLDFDNRTEQIVNKFVEMGIEPILVSGVSGKGMPVLLKNILEELKQIEDELNSIQDNSNSEIDKESIPVLRPQPVKSRGKVTESSSVNYYLDETDGIYVVESEKIERMVAMTQLQHDESLRYLYRRLRKIGIFDKLEELGIDEDDTVRFGNIELTYIKDDIY